MDAQRRERFYRLFALSFDLARRPPAAATEEQAMPVCRECEDEVDELVRVKVSSRTVKVCEDCADRMREDAEIAEESESVVQQMMGFKGRR
jgi:ribosome-binding protein aMBF1 (putative translation factor)